MRARDFLFTEASVFKKVGNQYVPGYRMAISSKAGGKAIKAIQNIVPDFDTTEELTIVPSSAETTHTIRLSKGGTAVFKLKRSNGQIIELQGTESEIESSLNGIGPPVDPTAPGKIKMPNKGDTAEALLGASMFAKMIKRTGKGIGEVSTEDVWEIFDNMKPVANDDYFISSKDLGGATDKVWFRLKVKGFVKMALVNPDLRKKLTDWLQSPVNYVNSDEGTEYASEFYKNGEPDELGIISDGLSAQSEKKTDVYTVVRDPKTNRVKRELLPISLKAGHEQFAQHSGSSWKAMEEMFGLLGVNFSGDTTQTLQQDYEEMQSRKDMVNAASKVYKSAEMIINGQFKSPQDEAKFIKQTASAIRYWATNDDDNVRLVAFGNKGQYEVLRFDKLVPMMSKVQLRATFIPGENPRLHIKDQLTGQLLLQIRTYIQQTKKGPYQRNVIEKGPLIGTIANAIAKNTAEPKPQVPQVQKQPQKPIKLGPANAQPGKLPTKAKTDPVAPVAPVQTEPVSDEEPVKV